MTTWKQKLEAADPKHASREHALVAQARVLTKLQMRRRRLKQELRETNRQIRVTQKELRALMVDPTKEIPWNEQAPPSRLFGED